MTRMRNRFTFIKYSEAIIDVVDKKHDKIVSCKAACFQILKSIFERTRTFFVALTLMYSSQVKMFFLERFSSLNSFGIDTKLLRFILGKVWMYG